MKQNTDGRSECKELPSRRITLKRWEALTQFVDGGVDNNIIEILIRPSGMTALKTRRHLD
jgi:hypothetical protein